MKKLFISLTLLSCASVQGAGEGPQTGLKTQVITVCGRKVEVELALNPQQQRVGLMGRTGIDKNKGMLFVFTEERVHQFWMKNVPFDIDIGFFDAKGKLVKTHTMAGTSPLMREGALPHYSSVNAAFYALEVPPGFFKGVKNCRLEGYKAP